MDVGTIACRARFCAVISPALQIAALLREG